MDRHDLAQSLSATARRARYVSLAATVSDPRGEVSAAWPDDDLADSRYEVGSITKVATGVLLADMVLAGEVSLGDPVDELLAWDLPWPSGSAPTLGELATHRSGLPNTPRSLFRGELLLALGLSRRNPWDGVTGEEYRAMVADAARSARRPRGHRYSSMGFGLLGNALAAKMGTCYEDLVTERVLLPLGMDRSTFARPGGADAVARGHTRRGRPVAYLQDLMPAAGSLVGTTKDLTRLLRAGLPGSPAPSRLREAIGLSQQRWLRLGPKMYCGLGWMLIDQDGATIAWHNGATWGFRGFAACNTATQTTVAVLTNSSRSVDKLGFNLLGLR